MFTRSTFRSVFASALLGLSLFACASDTDENLGDDALAEAGESEVRADSYVGKWEGKAPNVDDFVSLHLKAGGRYEAQLQLCPPPRPGEMGCLAMPRPESGRFTLLGSANNKTLRLVPDGASVRRYKIAFAPTVAVVGAPRAIELTRSGKTQLLNEVVANGGGPTCGQNQCSAGQVCCNPLAGICTPPGGVCAQ
jgi:hypothetical protein